MKNITFAVDEHVLAAVRRYATERNCSLNSLVREYLTNLARQGDRLRGARTRLRVLSAESQGSLGPKVWTRDELYDRKR